MFDPRSTYKKEKAVRRLLLLVRETGVLSRARRPAVIRGSDSPPDCHSLPLLLRPPQHYKKEKQSEDCFSWCGKRGSNPYGKTTRPSNVRVCQFRHSRDNLIHYTRKIKNCQGGCEILFILSLRTGFRKFFDKVLRTSIKFYAFLFLLYARYQLQELYPHFLLLKVCGQSQTQFFPSLIRP